MESPWNNLPEQYRKERWAYDYDEPSGKFFVYSGGYRVLDSEDTEVCEAVCKAFNAASHSKPDPTGLMVLHDKTMAALRGDGV